MCEGQQPLFELPDGGRHSLTQAREETRKARGEGPPVVLGVLADLVAVGAPGDGDELGDAEDSTTTKTVLASALRAGCARAAQLG